MNGLNLLANKTYRFEFYRSIESNITNGQLEKCKQELYQDIIKHLIDIDFNNEIHELKIKHEITRPYRDFLLKIAVCIERKNMRLDMIYNSWIQENKFAKDKYLMEYNMSHKAIEKKVMKNG